MKTMKFWRNILVMTAAMLSLASCSSDDNDDRCHALPRLLQ